MLFNPLKAIIKLGARSISDFAYNKKEKKVQKKTLTNKYASKLRKLRNQELILTLREHMIPNTNAVSKVLINKKQEEISLLMMYKLNIIHVRLRIIVPTFFNII